MLVKWQIMAKEDEINGAVHQSMLQHSNVPFEFQRYIKCSVIQDRVGGTLPVMKFS